MILFFSLCLGILGCDQVQQTFKAELPQEEEPSTPFDASCYSACANYKKSSGNQWAKEFYQVGQKYLPGCQKQQKEQKKDLHCQAKATGICVRACVKTMQKQ